MSHIRLALVVVVVSIKLSLLHVAPTSCLTSYNDARPRHHNTNFNQHARRRHFMSSARRGSGSDHPREPSAARAHENSARGATPVPSLGGYPTASGLLIARDNKIDDLFFGQKATTTGRTIVSRLEMQFEDLPAEEKPAAPSPSDLQSSMYNTINLDNSLEEPEMFTNNHHPSAGLYLTPESPAISRGHSTTSGPTLTSGGGGGGGGGGGDGGGGDGQNSRHYLQTGSQMKGPNQFHSQGNHQHHHLSNQGNYYHNHNYGKYPSNMFANNYNLNYIHSFLASKPPSSPPPPVPSGNLLNMPDFLTSNPNRLTLGTYGGYASAYISASSALSAAVNNIQLAMNQKQQRDETPRPVDSTLPEHPPNVQVVNASIENLPGSAMCGRQQVAYREPRVVGGNNTYEGEFPWAVSVQRHGNHHCGGVIVGKRWILTAAHCVRSQLVGNLIVRTGGHTLSRSANSLNGHMEKDYQVEQIVMHDDFSRYDNLTISQLKSPATTNNADIALLKLKYEIHWNELAWPVCFPNREAGNFSGHDATVIGWGKLNEKSEEFSNELQKVKLTIIDNKVCQNWFRQAGRDMPIDDRIICAGFKSGGKDACHGDSGGPLLSRVHGQYVVVGVVSTGIGCARPLLPGLYSRVSSYIDWIERYITS